MLENILNIMYGLAEVKVVFGENEIRKKPKIE